MKSMKTMKLSLAVAAGAAILMLVTGCYYMPGSAMGAARVGLGVKGIPPNLASAALVVTAPGMTPISAAVSPSAGSITVSVPAGPARTFTLLLNSPSATLEGVATVDLQPGESTQISVTPTVGATQILAPDLLNSRLVQISDMTGAGWTTITGPMLSTAINAVGAAMTPFAVDFDGLGRIYVASNSALGLFRIDDINHPSSASAVIVDANALGTPAELAVDRAHGLVYYANGGTILNQKDVNNIGAAAVSLNLASDISIVLTKSIAADDQGILYVIVQLSPSYKFQVIKYDPTLPAGSRILATSTFSFDTPWGIMVKGPYVYVSDANTLGTQKAQIVRFDKNLNFVDSFSGPPTDKLGRPETFLAILNKKITVIDEGTNGAVDRIVSFDDMTGSGWESFGSNGTGTNLFQFYSVC